MKQKPENGKSNMNNLSDQKLDVVAKETERSVVESELKLPHSKLMLDRVRKERKFRNFEERWQTPQQWRELWDPARVVLNCFGCLLLAEGNSKAEHL